MFLHLSVILFMGVMMSLPVWLPGAMFLPNGGLCPGDLCREGVSVQGRCMSRDSLSVHREFFVHIHTLVVRPCGLSDG